MKNYIKMLKKYIGTIDDWLVPLIMVIIIILDVIFFTIAKKQVVIFND